MRFGFVNSTAHFVVIQREHSNVWKLLLRKLWSVAQKVVIKNDFFQIGEMLKAYKAGKAISKVSQTEKNKHNMKLLTIQRYKEVRWEVNMGDVLHGKLGDDFFGDFIDTVLEVEKLLKVMERERQIHYSSSVARTLKLHLLFALEIIENHRCSCL